MPVAVLTLAKLALLLLLYVFLYRAVRTVATDLRAGSGNTAKTPPPRPATAASTAATSKRVRRLPRELVVHPQEGPPQVVTLGASALKFGRAGEVQVRLTDVYVSDEHAEVLPDRDDAGWLVRDLGSTNGTFLNGAKVTGPTPLAAGDQIRMGKTRIEVRR
ncbi:MAG: FHA domain-containing protein [Actinomycetes bacterium]